MKNILSPELVKFANSVAKIPFAKTLLKPVYYRYKRDLDKKRNQEFHKNALNVLREFDECMTSNGHNYVLLFGSLLGAVREHGFISHDLDMDVAIWFEDYNPKIREELEKVGFKIIHSHEIDDGKLAKEDTYEKDNVSIDVFFIYPAIDEYPYVCSKWRPVGGCVTKLESMKKFGYITGKRLELPIKKEIIRCKFENIMLPIPANADEILRFYYGEDYLHPNAKWAEAEDFPYRKAWHDKKAKFITYK